MRPILSKTTYMYGLQCTKRLYMNKFHKKLANEEDEITQSIFQTEIKNWSSHSIGGKKIDLNADEQDLISYAKSRFNEQWNTTDNTLKHDYVSKVLKKMKNHREIAQSDTVKPLICFWYPIRNETKINEIESLFEVDCSSSAFNQITFFSMSLYLRKLLREGHTNIEIQAPNIEFRISFINGLISL
jgi:hypothetical protein